jgi:hypothetical protein
MASEAAPPSCVGDLEKAGFDPLRASLDLKKYFAERAVSAIIVAFQSERGRKGYAGDFRWTAGLCRSLWAEEQLWVGLVRVPRGPKMRTHLMHAAQKGDVDRVRWLLARGGVVDQTDVGGWTALLHAATTGEDAVIRVLMAAGADPHTLAADGSTSLLIASQFGHARCVRFLLDIGANLNAARLSGETPIHAASEKGHVEVLKCLVAAGANVNASYNGGKTPLHAAASQGRLAAMELLIAAGADAAALYKGEKAIALLPASLRTPEDPRERAQRQREFLRRQRA